MLISGYNAWIGGEPISKLSHGPMMMLSVNTTPIELVYANWYAFLSVSIRLAPRGTRLALQLRIFLEVCLRGGSLVGASPA